MEYDYYEQQLNSFNQYIGGKELVKVKLEDLKIGDIVYVQFCPYSQKYLYDLIPKYGEIISIGDEYKIKNQHDFEERLLYGSVSYYGDTLGYDYDIYLVK